MKTDLWKRLDAVTKDLGAGNQLITIIQRADERAADVDQKLTEYRAGHAGVDVQATPINGPELIVVIRRFGLDAIDR